MHTQTIPASGAEGHRPPVTSHESPVTSCKPFSFTLLSKNASANPLVSHSCRNKGLKVPCFHTLTKKGVGEGVPWGFSVRLPTSDLQPPLSQSRALYASPDSRRDESRLLSPFAALERI